MTILLDSTVLIDALRKKPEAVAELGGLLRNGHTFATSVINVGEIYSGIRTHEVKAAKQLFAGIDVHPVTFEIAKRAGDIRNMAARKGRTYELDDMLIAATALELGIPVFTDNLKDFKSIGVALHGPKEN